MKPGKDSGRHSDVVFEPGDLPGFELQLSAETETLRLSLRSIEDNSSPSPLTLRSFATGVAHAAMPPCLSLRGPHLVRSIRQNNLSEQM